MFLLKEKTFNRLIFSFFLNITKKSKTYKYFEREKSVREEINTLAEVIFGIFWYKTKMLTQLVIFNFDLKILVLVLAFKMAFYGLNLTADLLWDD